MFGTTEGVVWAHFVGNLGHFGGTQRSFWGYSVVTLRVLWDHYGFIFRTILGVLLGNFEDTL